MELSRRVFLRRIGLGTAGLLVPGVSLWAGQKKRVVPPYLKGFESLYAQDPRKAALAWFKQARFGLFFHYGLYSLLGRGEWVQFHQKIPVGEYEKLKYQFTAEHFDTDFLTDLALEAGMKYVTMVTMHHDGFCLFRTQQTDFNSLNSAAHRDLLGELAEQCHRKGLGLGLYYSHGRHWRHPHAMTNDKYDRTARPHYPKPDPYYAIGALHDIRRYVAYCREQVRELLTQYGPIAYVWFDGWSTPMAGPWREELQIPELYQMVRQLQPQCLIAYKLGITGTEDFLAPEIHWLSRPDRAKMVKESHKPVEICLTISGGWGYRAAAKGHHKGVDYLMKCIETARKYHANLLINVAPLPDGSIDPQDVATLRAFGQRVRKA